MEDRKTFHYKLDFLYQSIAIYAATLVLYLLVRGLFINKEFPVIWNDPVLYLLCLITILSVVGLAYNLLIKRRIRIELDTLRFISSVRQRAITRDQVKYVKLGREHKSRVGRGVWVITIRLKNRRRPARVFPFNFERSEELLEAINDWAGPLAVKARGVGLKGRRGSGPIRTT